MRSARPLTALDYAGDMRL